MIASFAKPQQPPLQEQENTPKLSKGLFIVSSEHITVGSCSIVDNGEDGLSSTIQPPIDVEQHCRLLEVENQALKASEKKQQQLCTDVQCRERGLLRRLANKEQELQDCISQITEHKSAQVPGPSSLRSALIDPAINLLLLKLKKELQATKFKLEETQNELAAWKFTPDSNTGKRLMAKCRLLYQENEELGKMTSNGRLAKLEGELAMQKSFNEEVKKSQSELDDFLQELDEDVEGMQSTILFLQQELKSTRERIQFLEKENLLLKSGTCSVLEKVLNPNTNDKILNTAHSLKSVIDNTHPHEDEKSATEILLPSKDENRASATNISNSFHTVNISLNEIIHENNSKDAEFIPTNHNPYMRTTDFNSANNVENSTNFSSEKTSSWSDAMDKNSIDKKNNLKKRIYDSDSSDEHCSTNGGSSHKDCNIKLQKKSRRSSFLSIDLNEDDTKMEDEIDEKDSTTNETRIVSPVNQRCDN